jgi:exonuclease SbcC
LREQRAGDEKAGRVAKALAGHLRANNFERWLLEEALDLLVEGASRILRELSSGQYDLVHDKGEFFVVDHHDASLRRGVRTLSGGETFQASLALALALAEQLAGLSTGAASLESILLDEGFGTLDAATLDTVAATLEGLAARGDRMVGVVTHVQGLAERVPVRFEVSKDARTARVERVG